MTINTKPTLLRYKMNSNQPLVSIITVNYNQLEITCALFDSIRRNSYKNVEVILVDNASKEDPALYVTTNYPEVTYLRSDVNLGFAGGNNLALPEANGEFLFFVNNDAELTDNCIEILLAQFDQNPNLGIISPRLCYYPSEETNHKQLIQFVGCTPVNNFTARNKTLGILEEDKGQYTQAKPIPYIHGAAMMIPKKVMEKTGPMDEMFFLYYEELDWSERIKKAGFEVYVEPNALVFHKESVSVGKLSTLKTYYLNRNRILFMRRNKNWFQFLFFLLFLAIATIPKNTIVFIIKGQWDHLKAFYRALSWNIFNDNKSDKCPSLEQFSTVTQS